MSKRVGKPLAYINIIFSIKDIGSYNKVWGLLSNYTIWKV